MRKGMGTRGGGCRMTGPSSIVRVSLGVLFLTLLAVVAACSGDGEEPTSTDEPAPSPVATATEAPLSDEPSASDAAVSDAGADPTPMMPEFTVSGRMGGALGDTAPEFTGISEWLNSEPLMMAELRGDVVLIDFWTYTCVNCIRTMPYLRDWNEKYAERGLTMIGVHTPEFDFEKITENVVAANDELGVVWPVAQDNDFGTWRSYNNRFWPAKYLIDADGVVRYTHFGEGAYDETEHHIRALLEEAGKDVSDIAASEDTGPTMRSSERAIGTSVPRTGRRERYTEAGNATPSNRTSRISSTTRRGLSPRSSTSIRGNTSIMPSSSTVPGVPTSKPSPTDARRRTMRTTSPSASSPARSTSSSIWRRAWSPSMSRSRSPRVCRRTRSPERSSPTVR